MLAAMWSCRKQAWSSCYLASSLTTYVHNMTRRKESELQETKYSARYSKPPLSRPFPFQVSNNPLPLSLSYHFLYTKIGKNLHRIIGHLTTPAAAVTSFNFQRTRLRTQATQWSHSHCGRRQQTLKQFSKYSRPEWVPHTPAIPSSKSSCN